MNSNLKTPEEAECVFSTNIGEQLTCSQDFKFDQYGFPVKMCPYYPCEKYKKVVSDVMESNNR